MGEFSIGHTLSQNLYLRSLGLVYFMVFFTMIRQFQGLHGKKGILPIATFLEDFAQFSKSRQKDPFLQLPTLFWWKSDDVFLGATLLSGLFFSFFLMLGIFPAFCLLALWILYASWSAVGQDFYSFQWDSFLLEAGCLAIFFSLSTPPSPALLAAQWLLIFRFMFSSGLVKLMSGDPTWRNLKALCYHYYTQPLPNKLSWYLHHLPLPVHKVSTALVLVIELVIPFLIFGSDLMRLGAFIVLVAFQIILMLSGNLAFLNILTIVTCLPLLHNRFLSPNSSPAALPEDGTPLLLTIMGTIFLFIQLGYLIQFIYPHPMIQKFLRKLSKYHVAGSYGLFSVMTTSRKELVVEGSRDGLVWVEYEFPFKPGDPYVAPRQAAPYHPRLDWQMWFAALHPYQQEPWLINFLVRLLQNSPEVLALLKTNPFPGNPPRFLRLNVYDYHFSDPKTRKATGLWWERTLVKTLPSMSLKNPQTENTP